MKLGLFMLLLGILLTVTGFFFMGIFGGIIGIAVAIAWAVGMARHYRQGGTSWLKWR
jgi:hypothetical protein